MSVKRVRIRITGIVQGVGFRPTVFRYASDNELAGYVNNTSQGVLIEVEGEEKQIDNFVSSLRNNPPPLSQIEKFTVDEIDSLNNGKKFEIVFSESSGEKNVHISPDLATCKDCVDDVLNKSDRRHQYPFTNCTNCGPRFSIICDRPYDRKFTSMDEFKMCPDCQGEYDDPLNRRFHAQPNACTTCGPQLKIIGDVPSSIDPIEATTHLLKDGKIAAIKGLGGFNLAVDPLKNEAVQRLRTVKNRPTKAFALMMRNIDTIKKYCHVCAEEENALCSPAAPIVLLRKKNCKLDNISPDNNYLGVILPYTPLHHLLFQNFETLLFTSANRADEPIAIDDKSVVELIDNEIADFALTNNRAIEHRCDDSIVQFINGKIQVVRRSRGFVPKAFQISNAISGDNLALGANMKNTFALRKGNEVYISQHIGELSDFRNYEYQNSQIEDFKKLLEINPSNINGDAHPGYENYNRVEKKVFHHHAHMLSAMGEHNLLGKDVLGVICDGTGFGTDGKIWGLEFLSVSKDYTNFIRKGHLQYFHLPGGEKAIREIDRIAISLVDADKKIKGISSDRQQMINMLIEKALNAPETSSLGRLFDGVAALIGITHTAGYEAQAAILMQREAEKFISAGYTTKTNYPVSISDDNKILINHEELINSIMSDIESDKSIGEMSYKFHLWIVESIMAVINTLNPTTVVFSGGCFQNALLTGLIEQKMIKENIDFYFNHQIPINDAGISFGQALM